MLLQTASVVLWRPRSLTSTERLLSQLNANCADSFITSPKDVSEKQSGETFFSRNWQLNYFIICRWDERLFVCHTMERQTNKRSSYLSHTKMNNKHIFNDIQYLCWKITESEEIFLHFQPHLTLELFNLPSSPVRVYVPFSRPILGLFNVLDSIFPSQPPWNYSTYQAAQSASIFLLPPHPGIIQRIRFNFPLPPTLELFNLPSCPVSVNFPSPTPPWDYSTYKIQFSPPTHSGIIQSTKLPSQRQFSFSSHPRGFHKHDLPAHCRPS